MAKRTKSYIDVRKLKPVKKLAVAINGKNTEFKIGDKLRWPEDSPIVKTIVSMTIFEDGTVNYQLKWFDGCDFKSELVSVTDLKLLNVNVLPLNKISFDADELIDANSDEIVPIDTLQ